MRQLFHSVESTCNDEVIIFERHSQFSDQAQIVTTGLLPYLKSLYGDSVEYYFSPGAVDMQSKKRWDKEKGGVIGEDDEFISSISVEDSWWDDDFGMTKGAQGTKHITIDTKNMVSWDVPGDNGDNTLPSLQTKADDIEENGAYVMKEFLNSPPPIRCTIIKDKSMISRNITLDTQIETVESDIGNLDHSINHMAHIITKFTQELKQGRNLAPANFKKKIKDNTAVSNNTASTTITEDKFLIDQFQRVCSPGLSRIMVDSLTLKSSNGEVQV